MLVDLDPQSELIWYSVLNAVYLFLPPQECSSFDFYPCFLSLKEFFRFGVVSYLYNYLLVKEEIKYC